MTKKNFKELCSFHEYGKGINKRNAIYFNRGKFGFTHMVKASVTNYKKQELFNVLYDWVNEKIQQVPYDVQYRYAETEDKQFKVSIMG